ncbi:NAD-dependent epimerase/dehydratase family protein [Haloparvum sp. AD34]
MDVLITGAYGRCGTAIIDHLDDDPAYNFTYLNRSDRPADHPYGGFDTYVADITDYEAIRPAFDGQDAVVHLAAYPFVDGDWSDVCGPNLGGMYNVLAAACDAEVETFVFGSSNHVMGVYEEEHAPELYEPGYGLSLDWDDPVRPDSCYGTTKSFGEDFGRYYVDMQPYPTQFYALRICSVRPEGNDHPYGKAELQVAEGTLERGSEQYDRLVKREKAMWQSRRDFAHQIDCCLQDSSVTFGIYNGVSDNDRRWFSIQRAADDLGYAPRDNGEEWDEPPVSSE